MEFGARAWIQGIICEKQVLYWRILLQAPNVELILKNSWQAKFWCFIHDGPFCINFILEVCIKMCILLLSLSTSSLVHLTWVSLILVPRSTRAQRVASSKQISVFLCCWEGQRLHAQTFPIVPVFLCRPFSLSHFLSLNTPSRTGPPPPSHTYALHPLRSYFSPVSLMSR